MRIRVNVRAGARKERFLRMKSNAFDVQVKEPAERNAANNRVRALIAAHFGVPVGSVRFVAGMRGKNKTFDVIQ